MNSAKERFRRFREEHARLHDPAIVRESIELIPVDSSRFFADSIKQRKKREGESEPWLSASTRFFGAPVPDLPPPADLTANRPLIKVTPTSLNRRIHLFQEKSFACFAPGAKNVELAWAKDGAINRARLDHEQGELFKGQVALPEGDYLVALDVDGHTRPPQQLAQRVVINEQGLFAPLEVTALRETLVVTNCRRKDERVLLETQEPWIRLDRPFIDLLALETGKVSIEFDTAAMVTGPNEGCLHLKVWREEAAVSVGVIHFAVELIVGGAIAEFSVTPRQFGEINQGIDDVQLHVEVRARGFGPLNGMISLPQSGDVVDFSLNANDETDSRFTHTFVINSAALMLPQPRTTDEDFEVLVLTDSFLANYRLSRIQIPYKLNYLKKSLPALSFGTMRVGETKAMRLEVARSDAREVELAITLPSTIRTFVEAVFLRPDAYVFRLDARQLRSGMEIEETVHLIDRRSGLRDQIKVLAYLIAGS